MNRRDFLKGILQVGAALPFGGVPLPEERDDPPPVEVQPLRLRKVEGAASTGMVAGLYQPVEKD